MNPDPTRIRIHKTTSSCTYQCVQYGEDSLDVTKSQYLKASRLEDLAANMGSTHRPALVQASKAFTDNKGVRRARKEVNKWKSSRGDVLKYRSSPFLQFSNSDAALAIRFEADRRRPLSAVLRNRKRNLISDLSGTGTVIK